MKQKAPKKMTHQETIDRANSDAAAIIGVPVELVKKYLDDGKSLSDLINDRDSGKL